MKGKILLIYEGERTEKNILDTITKSFPQDLNENSIVPYRGNIYDLYSTIKKDCDDADDLKSISVFDIIKDRISKRKENERSAEDKDFLKINRKEVAQIYLFFDLDLHHSVEQSEQELKAVEEILDYFDEETEHGKLYISYPMVEALRDIANDNRCHDSCCVKCVVKGYKDIVGKKSSAYKNIQDFRRYNRDIWNFFCSHAICKANCILNNQYSPCTYDVGKDFTQDKIFEKQRKLVENKNLVYVLSGFPFFLLEYFGKNKWSEWQVPSGYKLEKAEVCPLKS